MTKSKHPCFTKNSIFVGNVRKEEKSFPIKKIRRKRSKNSWFLGLSNMQYKSEFLTKYNFQAHTFSQYLINTKFKKTLTKWNHPFLEARVAISHPFWEIYKKILRLCFLAKGWGHEVVFAKRKTRISRELEWSYKIHCLLD